MTLRGSRPRALRQIKYEWLYVIGAVCPQTGHSVELLSPTINTDIGSFDNEAEHFVWAMPIIADKRIPLEKLITHKVPLDDVELVLAKIEKGQKLDNREIVKAMMVPALSERE